MVAAFPLLLAALLALAVPLTGGAWRPDHLSEFGFALAALTASLPALWPAGRARLAAAAADRRVALVLVAVLLVLADTAALAWLSPLKDAAEERLAVDAIVAAAFVGGMSLALASAPATRLFFDALVAGLVLLAIGSVTHALHHGATLREGLAWPFVNHSQLGGMLATGAVVAFLAPRRGARNGTPPATLLRLGAAGFLITAAAATGSRSAFVALGAGLLAAVVAERPRSTPGSTHSRARKVALGTFTAAALAGAAFWAGTPARWNPSEVLHGGPDQDRRLIWKATARAIASSPLQGMGLGAYPSAIWRFTPATIDGSIDHAHSEPLELLAERGVAGVLPIALLVLVLARIFATEPVPPEGADERRALSTLALRAALLLPAQSCVDVVFATPGTVALSAVLLGVAVGARLRPRSRSEPRAAAPGFLIAGLAALLALPIPASFWIRARDRDRGGESGARRSLEHFPEDRVSLRRLAESGDLRQYPRLAALDPFDPWAALGAAALAEGEGRRPEAEAWIRRAEECFPDGLAPRRALLDFLLRHGRLEESLVQARLLAATHPERAAEVAVTVATALESPLLAEVLAPPGDGDRRQVAAWLTGAGASESALRVLSAIRAPAREDRVAIARAEAARRPATAVALWNALLTADPTDAEAALGLAAVAETPADLDLAASALRACAETGARRSTPEAVARALLGVLQRTEGAAAGDAWLDEAIARRPDESSLVGIRFERRIGAGRIPEAMADARILLERRPHDPRVRTALARIYEQRGLLAGARDLYRDALEVAPTDPEAQEGLARLSATPGR